VDREDLASFLGMKTPEDEEHNTSLLITPTHGDFNLLRPPSVVISDHDLHRDGEHFITLDELEAAFQKTHRRRLSDCSTCSSTSFAESEFQFCSTPPNEEDFEDEDPTTPKVSIKKVFFCYKYSFFTVHGHNA